MRPLLVVAALLAGCRPELELPFLADDSFADFAAGTLQDSGAKLYVAAAGNVQLIDRLDLDGDGFPDLALAPHSYGGDFQRKATIIRSSPTAPHTFEAPKLLTLPAIGSEGILSADVDADGWTDLFVANTMNANTTRVSSFLYRGSARGLDEKERIELPTVGAIGSAVADLNWDGYLDLVVCNSFDKGHKPLNDISSYVYWGSAAGLDAKNRIQLPVPGAVAVAAADLDEDGWLDLVFTSLARDEGANEEEKRHSDSLIHWGSVAGFTGPTRLPTFGAVDVSVADLDRDGALDVVFLEMHRFEDVTSAVAIFWGDRSDRRGYTTARRSELPAPRGLSLSIGDLNRDQELDLALTAAPSSATGYILLVWGPLTPKTIPLKAAHVAPCLGKCGDNAASCASCFFIGNFDVQGLDAKESTGSLIADLDDDGAPELILARGGSNARIYWGPYSLSHPLTDPYSFFRGMTELPGGAAISLHHAEPGGVRDRAPTQIFTSRVHEAPRDDPEILSLAWQATVPAGTRLRFQLRAAASLDALEGEDWGPYLEGTQALFAGKRGRYCQYRAHLEARSFARSPVLDRVVIRYR
jgi:hypothetical protein